MDLELDETQSIFRDTMRELLEREVPFARVRECERAQRADEALWKKLREQGCLGIACPEDLGGGGAGLLEAGILVEEVERRAALVPVAETLGCVDTVLRFVEGARREEFVRAVLSGGATPVPAVLEADDRLGSIAAEVDAKGCLRGEKRFVDYATFATHHVVAARSGTQVGLYLVETSDPAVKSSALRSIGRVPQSVVHYDGVRAERLCGADGHLSLVRTMRTLAAVQAVSCMQVALEKTVAYTSVREQFGRPIGTFQAVQQHAANMAIELESARFLAYEALDALARGTATNEQAAIAKAAASQSVPEVTMLAHQLHGGQGYIEENDLYFFTLRGKHRSLAWGTVEECLALLGDTIARRRTDWL